MTSSQEENKHSLQNKVSFCTPDFLARLICVVAFLIWSYVVIQKYINFGYDDWDLAFFNQATFNLLHGQAYSSLFGVNFFGNHSNFIAYLCLPIYGIIQHPLTLVHLKILSVVSGGYVFYLIVKNKLGVMMAIFLMVAYFLYPPNIYAVLYDFDYESLCPVFLFVLYYFFQENKWKWFLIFSLLTMLIKENMPLVIVTFGMLGFFVHKKDRIKWSVVPIVVGFVIFYLLTSKIIPFFGNKQSHGYMAYYQSFGNSPIEVIIYVLSHPLKVFEIVVSPSVSHYLINLFFPVLFLPILVPSVMLLMSPILLQHILSSAPTTHSIAYQYGITLAPFIFLGLAKFFILVKNNSRRSIYLGLIVLFALIAGINLYSNKNLIKVRSGELGQKKYLNGYAWGMIEQIPSQAGVIATLNFLTPLSNRKELYAFHKVYSDGFQVPEYTFTVPQSVNYALIDFNSPWLNQQFYMKPFMTSQRLRKFFYSSDWSILGLAENYVLLKKGEGKRLLSVSNAGLFSAQQLKPILKVDGKFSLISFNADKENVEPDSLLVMKFNWHSLEKINDRYLVVFELKKQNQIVRVSSRELGYLIYPTMNWQKDDVIQEFCSLYIPALEKGEYTIDLFFINLNKRKEALISGVDGSVQRYTLMNFVIQ